MNFKIAILYYCSADGSTMIKQTSQWRFMLSECFVFSFVTITYPDMPTFENQKEESLIMETRRADNRGPKGRYIEIQLRGVGEHCKLPHWGLGRSPSRFVLWCSMSFTDGLW